MQSADADQCPGDDANDVAVRRFVLNLWQDSILGRRCVHASATETDDDGIVRATVTFDGSASLLLTRDAKSTVCALIDNPSGCAISLVGVMQA